MTWRVARSLDVLLQQLDQKYPKRSRASDGSIGDVAHQAEGWTNSDHNPWYPMPAGGIVTARDYTHDPVNGVDIGRLSDELAASRDPRIKYIIANSYILDSRPGFSPWKWVAYHGSNPHDHHLHLSVMASNICDDTRPWSLPMLTGAPSTPTPPPIPSGEGGLPTVRYGERSAAVLHLQAFMVNHFGSYSAFTPTGYYGDATKAAVAEFQRRTGITGPDADGSIVGPRTNAKLWFYGFRG